MIVRGARNSDIKLIAELFKKMNFNLDAKHVETMLIAEEAFEPVAVMTINTLLECNFLTLEDTRQREKIEALKKLVHCGIIEVKNLGYSQIHAFANQQISGILKKHFEFKPGVGENLILFVE